MILSQKEGKVQVYWAAWLCLPDVHKWSPLSSAWNDHAFFTAIPPVDLFNMFFFSTCCAGVFTAQAAAAAAAATAS
jgi:hypothetical protein